jgi:hypothetical protein
MSLYTVQSGIHPGVAPTRKRKAESDPLEIQKQQDKSIETMQANQYLEAFMRVEAADTKRNAKSQPIEIDSEADSFERINLSKPPASDPVVFRQRLLDTIQNHPSVASRHLAAMVLAEMDQTSPITGVQPQLDFLELARKKIEPTGDPVTDRQALLDTVRSHPSEATRCLTALFLGTIGDFSLVEPLTNISQDSQMPDSVRNSAYDACQALWKSWVMKVREPQLENNASTSALPSSSNSPIIDLTSP